MSEHLSTDAIVGLGAAVDWNLADALRHLEMCDDCREQLELLRLARAGLTESEAVDAVVLRRIQASLHDAAGTDRIRRPSRDGLYKGAEVLLAGLTAVVIAMWSGIDVDTAGAAAGAFLVAALVVMLGYVVTGRAVPSEADAGI